MLKYKLISNDHTSYPGNSGPNSFNEVSIEFDYKIVVTSSNEYTLILDYTITKHSGNIKLYQFKELVRLGYNIVYSPNTTELPEITNIMTHSLSVLYDWYDQSLLKIYMDSPLPLIEPLSLSNLVYDKSLPK